MSDIRMTTLACTVLVCVMLLVLHALMARFWLARNLQASPQKATAVMSLALNIPLSAAIVTSGLRLQVPSGELLLALVYGVLAFNSVAYAYFHFFNLSETGRRIRMLLQLLEGEQIVVNDKPPSYSVEAMISQRLVRLLQMGQIVESGGRYRIESRFLLATAKMFRFVGQLTTGRS
ncbi:MAG: hypothetical protein V4454_15290 [Pseudomonadota bacterium]